MAKDPNFEQYLDSSYPPGSLEARYIDDAIRNVKEGNLQRLDQEHYWRTQDQTGYDAEAEGAHRPESARAYVLTEDPTNGVPFPAKKDYHEGLLIGIQGTKSATSLVGTAWVAIGSKLRQLVEYVRGKFRVSGQLFVGPNPNSLDGSPAGNATGYTFSEDYPQGQNAFEKDNITLYPYYKTNITEIGGQKANSRTLWPVRIGRFDPATGVFTKEATDEGSYGLAISVGNWPSDGTLFVISRTGIEAYGNADTKIYFNGLNVREHNHSGEPGMGAKIDIAQLIQDDPTKRITAIRRFDVSIPTQATLRDSFSKFKEFQASQLFDQDDLDNEQNNYTHVVSYRVKSFTHTDGSSTPRWIAFGFAELDANGNIQNVLIQQTVVFFSSVYSNNGFVLSAVFGPGQLDPTKSYALVVKRISDNETGSMSITSSSLEFLTFRG